ncbi:MAG: glycosyltransferase, partial [Planctomycetota bacterium]
MARIGIIAPRQITYSETFIRAHVERMREGVVALSPQELHSLWHGRDLLPVPSFWRILAAFVPPRSGWNPEAALIAKARQRFFRRKGIDCVLAEYGTIGSAWTDLLAQAGIPHVVHFHGYDAYVSSVLEERRDAYARMFRQCAAIVAVSHDMVEQLIGLGAPPEKVRYNPYGVDCELFSQTSPEKNPPLFVGVGRFVEKKAPYLVILAFRQVLEEHPEARLQLIGEGPLFGLCTDLVRELGLGHAVQLPGRLSHAEVASALTGARAFVQHSVRACDGDSEGTPVAILEAGAVGLPVVATRHAGIKDVVTEGETGLLVDEREVVGMAECMLQLARDPELAGRLGAAARRRIRSEFTMEQSIARLADIMEDARVCRPTVVHAVPANASRSVRQRWQRLLARAKRRALGYVLGVLKAVVPDRHWALVSKARHFGFSRYCPICESRLRRFRPYGIVPRLEALCPVCGSLERHRVAWLYLRSKTDLFDGRAKSVLHIGPESAIASRLSGAPGIRYLSVDLSSPLAMVRMDITDLALPDRSFDVVCCSHVLEHVPEDRKALAEVHRVLKPGGWALIQVPLYGEETVEAPGMSDPGERARAFDQHDHFRKYGRDIMERLMEAGLSATLDESMARLSVQRRRRMGLRHASLFVCRKQVGGAAGRLSRARGPLISVIVPAHNAEPYL